MQLLRWSASGPAVVIRPLVLASKLATELGIHDTL